MSLAHAILGFLHRHPMTGYELKTQCFDKSVSYFWPADQAQIYRTLEKMESEKWVESQLEVQNDHPNRKLYFITNDGRAEFDRWLETKQPLPVHREPFLVQLYFSEGLKNHTIIELLEQQRAMHEMKLREYKEIEIRLQTSTMHNVPREISLASITLSLGIRTEEAYIEWIEETISRVRQLPAVENND